MDAVKNRYPYPRRRVIRRILKTLIHAAFGVLGDVDIFGRENIPAHGPAIIVANHFSFLDPLAVIDVMPMQPEFLGGAATPNAPGALSWIRNIWKTYPVYRGSVSREALTAAQAVLAQNGALAIFPEGGSWATVLRPARPGAAFLAVRSGAPILPVGLDGFADFFKRLRAGKRPHAVIRIGKLFGPFKLSVRNRDDRAQLDAIGNDIMRHIAELIPEEQRGCYSSDPAIREAARGTEVYPWDENPEG
ncbi:MAG: 1-acyl-sn-glycerol-3-phosphate acyltransferase [Anaerolineae bacterium]|nr:1-acyl-sn-glycerol-3-phosphate acyltransferase [Anaerolineae bacterium]